MQLFYGCECVRICLKNTDKYVATAVGDLINDFERVSSFCVRPEIVSVETDNCIVIEENDDSVEDPVSDESFSIKTDGNKIRISAKSYLGSMWGIYTFSERFLGVDPCYLFNDLKIEKREYIDVTDIDIREQPNGFTFRGIFINDEDLLGGWKEPGGARHVGGGFYMLTVNEEVIKKVVETALRLKLNLVIPATFLNIENAPEKAIADAVAERGIYISQHHCEPLGVSSL